MTDDLFDQPAILSPDGNLRYVLTRRWGRGQDVHQTVNFIMCNPSTADEVSDDATLKRCMGFTQRWGYHRLIVTNVHPFRSRYVSALQNAVLSAQEWATNDRYIRAAADASALVVAGWGSGPPEGPVRRAFVQLGDTSLHCLGTNRDGRPRHPLGVPKTQKPAPFWM